MSRMAGTGAPKIVYDVVTRDGKSYWRRIGEAFVNRDGSIAITFHETPVISHTIQVRDARGKDLP